MKIKFFKPYITGNEIEYIKDLIDNGLDLSGDGKYTKLVHTFLEERYKVPKALLTTSGTTALELAVRLLNLNPGDEIIVPSFTFSSTVNAVLMNAGLKVIFADIEEGTLNIDPQDIEKKITNKTKAIIVVHYAGVACDMDRIMKIANTYNVKVIEDAAQALDAKYKDKYLGTIGHIGCISFHDTKNISSGEGGAIFINQVDNELLEKAEILREKGTNRTKFFQGLVDKYTWVDIGSSYLPSDLLAAFLLAQLESLEYITAKRMEVYSYYKDKVMDLSKKYKIELSEIPDYASHNAHIFYVILESKEARKFVLDYLRTKEIGASFHYIPLHSAPQGMKLGNKVEDLPITEDRSARLIRLPLFSAMSVAEREYVIESLHEALEQYELNKVQKERLSVSIGISAFNEEKNIQNILLEILKQKRQDWDLKEILVYCDGCSDKTVENALKVESDLIKVVDNKERMGKVHRVNQLCRDSEGAIFIILDADIKLANKDVITNIMKEFKDDSVMLVGGNSRPFLPTTFIEKALYSSISVYMKSREMIRGGNNIFACTGACIAMRNQLAKMIKIPDVINEDDYIYLFTKQHGFNFAYAKDSIVYYRLPTTTRDYLKQVFRSTPQAAKQNLGELFGNLLDTEFKRPTSLYVLLILKELISNPLGTVYISFIRLLCIPFFRFFSKEYKLSWYTAESTKI